jgi:hypothetical protein
MSILQTTEIANLDDRKTPQAKDEFILLTPDGDLMHVDYKEMAGAITSEVPDYGGDLSDLQGELDELNKVKLPELDRKLDTLNHEKLPHLQAQLDELGEVKLPELDDELDELNTVKLPHLQKQIDDLNENILPSLNTRLDTLGGYLQDPSTIPDNYTFFEGIVSSDIWAKDITATKGWFDSIFTNSLMTNRITSNEIDVKGLLASSVFAEQFIANNGYIKELIAHDVFADKITSNELDVKEVIASTVFEDQFVANEGYVDELIAQGVFANKITANMLFVDVAMANKIFSIDADITGVLTVGDGLEIGKEVGASGEDGIYINPYNFWYDTGRFRVGEDDSYMEHTAQDGLVQVGPIYQRTPSDAPAPLLLYKGEYDSETTYYEGDIIQYTPMGKSKPNEYVLIGKRSIEGKSPDQDTTHWTIHVESGSKGPTGPQGPKGDDGSSVTILGTKSSVDDLPSTGNTPGDGYLVDGDLYVWDGSQWNDVGQIRGPKGKTAYVHYAWADSSSPSTIYQDPTGHAYIGVYSDHIKADSSDPDDYIWSRYKGKKGDKGNAGPGLTSRGSYSSKDTYYYTDERRDVVLYHTNTYDWWMVAGKTQGSSSLGTPSASNGNWTPMNQFSSVATDWALTKAQTVTQTLTIGDAGHEGLLTDYKGAWYLKKNDFQFGGSNGIYKDGSNIHLGTDVILNDGVEISYGNVSGTKPPKDATKGADWRKTLTGIPTNLDNLGDIPGYITSSKITKTKIESPQFVGNEGYFSDKVSVGEHGNVLIKPGLRSFDMPIGVSGSEQTYSTITLVGGSSNNPWTSDSFQAVADDKLVFTPTFTLYGDDTSVVNAMKFGGQIQILHKKDGEWKVQNNADISVSASTYQSSGGVDESRNVKANVVKGDYYKLQIRISANHPHLQKLEVTPKRQEFESKTWVTDKGIFYATSDVDLFRLDAGASIGGGGGSIHTTASWDNIVDKPFTTVGDGLAVSNGALAVENPFDPSGTYADLRAKATTKGDVGLGSVDNYSQSHYDSRYFDIRNFDWNTRQELTSSDDLFEITDYGPKVWRTSNPENSPTNGNYIAAELLHAEEEQDNRRVLKVFDTDSQNMFLNYSIGSTYQGWQKVLTDANTGSAVTKDISYFRNASNLNAGTVSNARLPDEITTTQLLVETKNNSRYPLTIANPESEPHAVGIKFDDQTGNGQTGFIEGNHWNADSYGAGYSVHVGSSESTFNFVSEGGIVAEGKSMFNEDITAKAKIKMNNNQHIVGLDTGGTQRILAFVNDQDELSYGTPGNNLPTVIGGTDVRFQNSGTVDIPTAQIDTLRTTLFKPETVQGMASEFVFTDASTISAHRAGRLQWKVKDKTGMFDDGDLVAISSGDYNEKGYTNIVTKLADGNSDGVNDNITLWAHADQGHSENISVGDTIMRVSGDYIYTNGGKSYMQGYQGISKYKNTPFGGSPSPSWHLGSHLGDFNETIAGSPLSGDIGFAGTIGSGRDLAFAVTDSEGFIGGANFRNNSIWMDGDQHSKLELSAGNQPAIVLTASDGTNKLNIGGDYNFDGKEDIHLTVSGFSGLRSSRTLTGTGKVTDSGTYSFNQNVKGRNIKFHQNVHGSVNPGHTGGSVTIIVKVKLEGYNGSWHTISNDTDSTIASSGGSKSVKATISVNKEISKNLTKLRFSYSLQITRSSGSDGTGTASFTAQKPMGTIVGSREFLSPLGLQMYSKEKQARFKLDRKHGSVLGTQVVVESADRTKQGWFVMTNGGKLELHIGSPTGPVKDSWSGF